MSKRVENDCYGCDYPSCMGCPKKDDYIIYDCDLCGAIDEDMYYFDGNYLCEDCLFEVFLTGLPDEEAEEIEDEYDLDAEETADWEDFKQECRLREEDD